MVRRCTGAEIVSCPKGAIPVSEQDGDGVARTVHDDEVEVAICIEISDADEFWGYASRIGASSMELTVARSEKHRDGSPGSIWQDQVQVPIPIEIDHSRRREGAGRVEGKEWCRKQWSARVAGTCRDARNADGAEHGGRRQLQRPRAISNFRVMTHHSSLSG